MDALTQVAQALLSARKHQSLNVMHTDPGGCGGLANTCTIKQRTNREATFVPQPVSQLG